MAGLQVRQHGADVRLTEYNFCRTESEYQKCNQKIWLYGFRIKIEINDRLNWYSQVKRSEIKMEYGYCRISTPKQNIDRQVRNILSAFPNAKIYKEIYTGTKTTGRKKLEEIVKLARSGDTIIFDSVSRMSRNADEGVNLVFIKEPHINTAAYSKALSSTEGLSDTGNQIADEYIKATRNMLKILAENQIRLAFEQSQKEVDDLHRRTSEGIETARRNGKQIEQVAGRKLHVKKAKPAKEIIQKHCKSFGGTLSDSECIKLAGISHNTFYKYKRELLAEMMP